MLLPSGVSAAIATTATSARINAYSAIPCPRVWRAREIMVRSVFIRFSPVEFRLERRRDRVQRGFDVVAERGQRGHRDNRDQREDQRILGHSLSASLAGA